MNMTNFEIWSLIIQALTSLLLLTIVLIALFGKTIREKIFPGRINIEILDKNGELTILDNGHRVIYYHLRVINTGKIIIKNCRIFLSKISKLENGEFINVPFSVPPRYVWSPAETSPEGVDIVTERIADFGYVIDSSTEFKPTVTPILNSFKGNLKHEETFRYFIEVISENYHSKKRIAIEVTWDGIWPNDLTEMCDHLVIIKVRGEK
jgi:hypothetical protein